jgi:hypothetical protein
MSQVPMRRLIVWRNHTWTLYRFPWGWRLRHIVWSVDIRNFRIAHEFTLGRPHATQSPSERELR